MLLLLPHLLPLKNNIKDCVALLQFLLVNPCQPLVVVPGTITENLVAAGVLTPDGFFNPKLSDLLPLLDRPQLAPFIQEGVGRQLLTLLNQLDPEEAETFKGILQQAAARVQTKARRPVEATASNASLLSSQSYAVGLAEHCRKNPLDEEFVSRHLSHHAEMPERIVFKIKKDLITATVINKLPTDAPCVARWNLYQALMHNPNYQPNSVQLEKAGVAADSVPALRAHCKRGGLYLIPCQLILHIGQKVLRVAAFSSANSFNRPAFDAVRDSLRQLPCPANLRLGGGKTFQLDGSIEDPGRMKAPQLFEEIKRTWEAIRGFAFSTAAPPSNQAAHFEEVSSQA